MSPKLNVPFLKDTLIMVSFHGNRKVAETEVIIRECGIAVTGLTMSCLGGMWKTLEI